MSAVFTPRPAAIDVDCFHRMGEAGVFDPSRRLELIEGEMLEMAPIGSRHASAVNVLTRLFYEAPISTLAEVSVQNPLVLGHFSEPQPDLMLLKPRADHYRERIPVVDDVLLLVEVAESTLAYDRGRKLALYARHGVPEVWILDLVGERLEIHRDPVSDGYLGYLAPGADELVAPAALPGVRLRWSAAVG